MHTTPDHEIAVIGAGPGGIGLAIALRRAGIDYVFEGATVSHTSEARGSPIA